MLLRYELPLPAIPELTLCSPGLQFDMAKLFFGVLLLMVAADVISIGVAVSAGGGGMEYGVTGEALPLDMLAK